MAFKVLDLFSGIGGFSLGLERTRGFETVAFCEIDEYCQKVLKKHWPSVPIYNDVQTLTKEILDAREITVDVITGGFPCQDLSLAGKQRGIEAERSGLWDEICRLACEIRPKYIIVENVTALLSGDNGGWFGKVLGDLATIGYDTEWNCIPASYLGACHQRDRVWLVAYPNKAPRNSNVGGWDEAIHGERDQRQRDKDWGELEFIVASGDVAPSEWRTGGQDTPHQSLLVRKNDGFPNIMDRLGCCGNAVVPQIPELIGRAILESERRIA